MPSVEYSLRINEADKQKAEQVFNALGITYFIKTVGQQRQKKQVPQSEKIRAFNAINGVLAGHSVDLDNEKEERLS